MKNWLRHPLVRFPLGVACLAAGGALLTKFGTSAALALTAKGGGVALDNLLGGAFGLMGVGGAWDLLVGRRAAPPAATVAQGHFATREEVARSGIAEDASPPGTAARDLGIYLGFPLFQDGGASAQPARYKGEKHLIFVGPTGSGKSASIIIPNMRLLRSLILTDPKGELAAITLRLRKTMGNTIVLNPFGVLTDTRPELESVGWNPLRELDPQRGDFVTLAGAIADAVIEKSGDGKGKFFDMAAENLFAAFVMWECFSKGAQASLASIPAELSKPTIFDKETKEPVSGFLHTLKLMSQCDMPAIADAGGRLYTRLRDSNSQSTSSQDVIDTVLANTKFLTDPFIKRDMAKGSSSSIDWSSLHRVISTIYVILPPVQLKDQARWMRIFVNLALRKLYGCAPNEGAPPTLPRVLMILDEFSNLGRLSEIVSALDMARFCRIQLMFFLQNMGQLTKRAYKDEAGSFFSNAGAAATFKTGALDTEGAKHLAEALGEKEVMVQTYSNSGGTTAPQAIPLIRAAEIAQLEANRTITIVEPCPWPVLLSTPVYVRTRFKDGLDNNPYYHG
jgi:type IV secretion system protein VirD4